MIRAEFVFPLSTDLPKYTRIEDGYLLSDFDKIIEVGKFSSVINDRILKLSPLKIIGQQKENEIPCLKGVLLPGFVKSHGHDAESPIVGIEKETHLTEWLDKCVNPFTSFLNENFK